jgi:hypothetical protein
MKNQLLIRDIFFKSGLLSIADFILQIKKYFELSDNFDFIESYEYYKNQYTFFKLNKLHIKILDLFSFKYYKKINIEYWIERGFSENEAIKNIKQLHKNNCSLNSIK